MSDGAEFSSLPAGLSALADPVFGFDEQGLLVDWNRTARQYVDDVENVDVTRAFVDGDAQRLQAAARRVSADSETEMVVGQVLSGKTLEWRLSPSPGDAVGAVAVGRETADNRERTQRERALRRAYEVVADADLTLDEKIDDLLQIVRETLETDFATLSHVKDDEYVIAALDGPEDVSLNGPDGTPVEVNDSIPLESTNCERVVNTGETLAFGDVERDALGLAERPVNAEMGISSYVGTPVVVGEETYGTFCFYDLETRAEEFSEWEITFVELLGSWVGNELERERLLEQRRQEDRKRYQTLVEQSSDGVVVVQDGKYVFINDRFVEITGYDRDELLGLSFEQVFTPEYRDLVLDRYERRIDHENPPQQYDVEVETPDGDVHTLELAVSRIEHGGEPATLATFRDVTDRKQREAAVRTLQSATQQMQEASSREEIAEIAVEAAQEAFDYPLATCWFYDDGRLMPAYATRAVHEDDRFVPLAPDSYENEVFEAGTVVDYVPREVDERNDLGAGILLPLGDHGLLAVGRPEPTSHDDTVLGVARTLAEQATTALDRVERTRELEQTRTRFRALTEDTTYAVVTIDADSTIRYASEAVEEVFGYTPEEVEGEPLYAVMPERFHDPHEQAVTRYLQEGEKHLDWSWIELPGQHRDGHEVPLGISFGEAVVDGEQRFSAVIRDITEQKERQQKLREERAFTESIFAALPDVFYAFDEHGTFLRWNDRLEEVTGYGEDEIAEMHPTDFIAPGDRASVVEAIAEVFEQDTVITVEAQFETAKGEHIPYEFTGAKLTDENGQELGLVGIGRDISDRKRRQRRFEAVFNNTFQFTGLLEPDGTLLEANDAALSFGDLDRDEVVGKKVWNVHWFSHSTDLQERTKQAVEQAANGEFVRDEVTVRGSDRNAIIDFSLRPVTDESGDVTLLIPEGRDITELKEREQELRRERDHVQRTEQLADVGGWEIDIETDTLEWTDGTRQLYEGSTEFEPDLEHAADYFHPEDRDKVNAAIEACRREGEPFDIEVRLLTRRGRTRWVRVEGERVTQSGDRTIRGVIRDISDRKEREQRLMVLNRVLRHNLRNKLSVVSSYAEQLEAELGTLDVPATDARSQLSTLDEQVSVPKTVKTVVATAAAVEPERLQRYAGKIQKSSETLVSLAEKAQQFERVVDETDVTGAVNVGPVLEELGAEYRENYPESTITVDTTDARVRGNRDLIRFAVDELLDNAIVHSDRDDPTIDVTVSSVTDGRVNVTVTDDGPGMPEAEQQVLAEGEETSLMHGSGVGLWTVNWLLTRIGGHISITETEPYGTAVTLTVPAVEKSE